VTEAENRLIQGSGE